VIRELLRPEPLGGPGQHPELDEHVSDEVLAIGQKQPVKAPPLSLRRSFHTAARHRKAMQPDLTRQCSPAISRLTAIPRKDRSPSQPAGTFRAGHGYGDSRTCRKERVLGVHIYALLSIFAYSSASVPAFRSDCCAALSYRM